MSFDNVKKTVIKCDLCDGEPLCVQFCAYEALQYVEATELNTKQQAEMAERILRITHKSKMTLSTME